MKNLSFGSFVALAREVGHAFLAIAAALIAALMRMPLPRLAAVCLVTALVVMILPLAITLFIVALVLKLLVGAAVFASRRREPPRLGHDGEQQ